MAVFRLGGMYHSVTVSLNQCQSEYTRTKRVIAVRAPGRGIAAFPRSRVVEFLLACGLL